MPPEDYSFCHDYDPNTFVGKLKEIRNTMDGIFVKAAVNYKEVCSDIFAIDKIIFNDPCVILIWNSGKKVIVRTQDNEPYDPELGYYLVLAKAMSSGSTYSELVSYMWELCTRSPYSQDLVEAFLMGKLGVKTCRKIAFNKLVPRVPTDEKLVNHTINFWEVLHNEH